jgi:hypothetical protein
MAYYAFLNADNIVTEVIAGKDETDTSENWEQFYGAIRNRVCKRTSYNTRQGIHYGENGLPDGKPAFRKNYAGIGYSYDSTLDAFIPPQPYLSWTLDNETADWKAPVPYPTDGKMYSWNETTQAWNLINEN